MATEHIDDFSARVLYYVDQYNVEGALFAAGREIKVRGYLLEEEFLSICLWKSRRPKQRYKNNTAEFIKTITQSALGEVEEAKKMRLLTELNGVQIPTASAILSVADPTQYPIIDVRCLRALDKLGTLSWPAPKPITLKDWLQYLTLMRGLAIQLDITPRDLDKALFAYNRMELDSVFGNLYG